MKHHLIEIKHDVFNIAKRFKAINKNFVVCFNVLNKSFELYSNRFGRQFFEQNLGKNLNAFSIVKTQKNKVENLSKIIEELDWNNHKLEQEKKENSAYASKQILKEFIAFADKKNCDVDFSNEKI